LRTVPVLAVAALASRRNMIAAGRCVSTAWMTDEKFPCTSPQKKMRSVITVFPPVAAHKRPAR
jgi:hypothetical protein